MCGIFGVVFNEEKENLGEILVQAGRRLSYRGYDSVGCATVDSDGAGDLRKDVGKVDEVAEKLTLGEMKGLRGITQLRWATFGKPSPVNAQPHFDCDGDLIGAHNGNVVNTVTLREQFTAEGHNVRGENDGEIVVHAVEKYYDLKRDMDVAVMLAARDLKGDYAYCITDVRENRLFAVKMGSSLYLGIGDGFTCCSSDLPSILDLTNQIVIMKDGEYAELTPEGYQIKSVHDGSAIERAAEESTLSPENVRKGGYDHFMAKEIHEQPDKVRALIEYCKESREMGPFIDVLSYADRIFVVGSGTSFHACLVGASFFNRVAGVAVIPVLAGEFTELYGKSLRKNDVILCVSQSGETKDVINIVNDCERGGIGHILAFVNVVGSTLHLRAEHRLPLFCDLEISVPATKTFINQVALFLWVASELAAKQGRDMTYVREEIERIPDLLRRAIDESEELCKIVAADLAKVDDLYCLGYGITHGIAREGALKIKEVVYNHCEGMYSSEFKHGPLSIVYEGYPIVFVTTPEDHGRVVSHMHEVSCRGGKVYCISEPDEELKKNSDVFLKVPPSGGLLSPFTTTIPLQLLAYYMAVERGYDPDFPRNLSKTLTVD